MDAFDRLVLGVSAALIVALGVVLALGDNIGVPVLDYAPGDGQSPPSTTAVRVTFGERMDAASAEAHFAIAPPVAGAFNWARNTMTFAPDAPLAPGATYTVTLQAGAQSAAGRRTQEDVVWSFTPRAPRALYLALEDGMLAGLWEAPIDGGAPRALFTAEYGLDSFAPSPDGSQIAVAVRTATPTVDIWLIEADGANPRKIVDCAPDGCGGLAWSPDGRLLAYELRERGGLPSRVWLYDLETGETAPVFQDRQVLGYAPTWSPDGSRLAFYDASVEGIRVLDLDSGAVAVIPTLMGEVGSFAPDGAQMVYADIRRVGRQFVPELWRADLSVNGGLAPLLEDGQDDQGGAWSPDGALIALGRHNLEEGAAGVATGRQLVLYDVASGALRPVTNDPAYNNTRFVWDPTGGWLLIQRYRLTEQFARPEIWVYDVAGGVLRQLAESGIDGGWLP